MNLSSILHGRFPPLITRLEIELLLCHILGISRSHLLAYPNRTLSPQQFTQFKALLSRREQGEPLAYLTGRKAFWSFELQVTPATLIPRPETELLVEQALARLPVNISSQVIDLGTGSGAIALALALERPCCQILAVDIDPNALFIAKMNAKQLNINSIEFLGSDWLTALGKHRVTLIVANPPYIAENDLHLQGDGVCCEPRQALISGIDGLDAIRHIIVQAPRHLVTNGWLLLEHGYLQGELVVELFKQHGYVTVTTYRDLAGQPRVTVGQYPY